MWKTNFDKASEKSRTLASRTKQHADDVEYEPPPQATKPKSAGPRSNNLFDSITEPRNVAASAPANVVNVGPALFSEPAVRDRCWRLAAPFFSCSLSVVVSGRWSVSLTCGSPAPCKSSVSLTYANLATSRRSNNCVIDYSLAETTVACFQCTARPFMSCRDVPSLLSLLESTRNE